MRLAVRVSGIAAVPLLALLGGFVAQEKPVDLVGEGPRAVLRFEITDSHGTPIPGRLTFLGSGGPEAELFRVVDAAPAELAVRKNVVYTLSGRAAITVPPGRYAVLASRGLEWSVAFTELELTDGEQASWSARLVHEVDTEGWISGDFHLHTLTHSGHGDAGMEERVISLVGEGVEFAVATDHDHNTDYGPTMARIGADKVLGAVTGNEVSTPVGHLNVFPLDPDRPVLDSSLTDANRLFELVRAEPTNPIIQINHPRWRGIDYFTRLGLDPVTATSSDPRYAADFDSIEILNENSGWGYHDPATEDVPTQDNEHSVLIDWFHLLDRGRRYAAVGNSDSHTVHYDFAGYPRNYVRSPTDVPSEIDPAHVAAAIRRCAVFTTLGPFVEIQVNGVGMGGDVQAADGEVVLGIRIQAASWIDCDRAKVIVNGELVETIDVPPDRVSLRLETQIEICLRRRCERHGTDFLPGEDERTDAWIVVLVEGDDPIEPIVHGRDRPIRPIAITNPVWVDADGDGVWTSPWERAVAVCESGDTERLSAAFSGPPAARALLLQAMDSFDEDLYISAVLDALEDPDRRVRLAALRAAERRPQIVMRPVLDSYWEAGGPEDAYLAVALLRAMAACGHLGLGERILALVERFDAASLRRYTGELEGILPGEPIASWLVLGPFAAPTQGSLGSGERAPESDPDPDLTYAGRDGPITWHELQADPASGFLDLARIAGEGAPSENTRAFAQTWLHTDEARRVVCALGTDDGCRVTLAGEVVYENPARKGANPLEHLAILELAAGWNRLVFEVENGTSSFGLFCRVLDPAVRTSARRPD